jgi:acetyl esterase/lipase
MLQGGLLLISIVSLFLCSWIIIPAPIFSLLPLSVATPEISPALLSFNLLLLLVLIQQKRKPKLALSLALIALILSALPLAQLPKAQAQADRNLNTFLNSIQKSVNVQNSTVQNIRSKAFSLRDFISGIPQSPIRETQNLTFTSDNTQLSLNLYRPSSPGLNPTIVTIYGGAWQRGTPNSDAVFNRYLASQGYSVWAISYRHAPAYTFPTQLQDVQAALRFIQNHAVEYEVDLNHVAIVGRSAGAQLASLAAYGASPFPIQSIVNYYGPVNLTSGYYNLPTPDPIDSRSVLTAFLGGTPAEFPDRYIQASPINSVKPGLPPSLLIYGGRDHIVESRFGKHLAEALTQNQNPVLFIEIPWADHAFDAVFQGVSNQFALYYVDRFLAATLKVHKMKE